MSSSSSSLSAETAATAAIVVKTVGDFEVYARQVRKLFTTLGRTHYSVAVCFAAPVPRNVVVEYYYYYYYHHANCNLKIVLITRNRCRAVV